MNQKVYIGFSMIVAVALAVLMGTNQAEASVQADRWVSNGEVCAGQQNLVGCTNCCTNAGYTENETDYDSEFGCTCFAQRFSKINESDMLYESGKYGMQFIVISYPYGEPGPN